MKVPYPYLELEGISDQKVLQIIRSLPRELFVPRELREEAYYDSALPIEYWQTISQPFIVAYMTEKLQLKPTDKILEIGTGSDFQAAVLAKLVKKVYTVEIYKELSEKAQKVLDKLGFYNIKYKIGDGKKRLTRIRPFRCYHYYCCCQQNTFFVIEQLKVRGKMILPLELATSEQYLVLVKKLERNKIEQQNLIQVRFVDLK